MACGLDHIEIQWSGYNDSMLAFVSGLMTRMKSMKEKAVEGDSDIELIFNSVKEKLLQSYKNFYL